MAYSFNPFSGGLDDNGTPGIADAPSDGGLYGRGVRNPSDVLLLLHMDGTDGSKSFVDSSLYNSTITSSGNAEISTTEKKFGPSSGLFNGGEDYLQITDFKRFEFGSENFTLECWIYIPDGGGGTVIARWGGGGNAFFLYADEAQGIVVYLNNVNIPEVCGGTITPNTWNHIALVRNGNDLMSFINGVQNGTTANFSTPINPSTSFLRIGGDQITNPKFNGYIDEVRITKGVARYTETFDVSTEPFTTPAPNPREWLTHTKDDILNNKSGPLLTLLINSDNSITGSYGSIGEYAYQNNTNIIGLQLGSSVTTIDLSLIHI